ncbi:competence protein ComGD [Gracilibacillus halotolerans]|uniref:Competence protein ComGD n=1 Tax=Gracilibacillus halotolerans TaxID=74386 RepID=A0A841RJW3_9BACI|nr:competence type IV pilus minor pilin ComGD [Gracilibacillus halotolerans]MBB6511776.1 competence protein ComGD [Gracilibacillus halotolerans]
MFKSERGYTLTELLLVLSIVSFLLSVIGGITYVTYERWMFQQFLHQFNQDLLYMQQNTMIKNQRYQLFVHSDQNGYTIREVGYGKALKERRLPNHWKIRTGSLSLPIQFSRSGSLNNPGSFSIVTNHFRFQIICPFGSGRCYHAK